MIGFVGGISLGVLQTSQRLAGILPNTAEVIKYGAMSPELLKDHPSQFNENYQLIGRGSKNPNHRIPVDSSEKH